MQSLTNLESSLSDFSVPRTVAWELMNLGSSRSNFHRSDMTFGCALTETYLCLNKFFTNLNHSQQVLKITDFF